MPGGLTLGPDTRDEYVGQMRKLIRSGRDDYFLDRLIVAGLVESRGCERFGMIAEALQEETLRAFYRAIADSEDRHGDVFIGLAHRYFDGVRVDERVQEILDEEADILSKLEIRAALH